MFSEIKYYKEDTSVAQVYTVIHTFTHLFDVNDTDGRISSNLTLLYTAFQDSPLPEYDFYLLMGDFFWNCGATRCAVEAYKGAKRISPLPDLTVARLSAVKKSLFHNKMCVVTGELWKMERAEALFEIRKRGGLTSDNPVNSMNYLILGNQEWSALNGGVASRKVQKAVELQDKGKDIKIISEDEFYSILDEMP